MELQRGGHKDGRPVDEIVFGIVEAAFGDRQRSRFRFRFRV